MSNQLKGMQKVLNLDEQRAQKQQVELQRQSFIVNTRLRLAETFLNTLLGRLDIEIEKNDYKEILPDIAIDYANELMTKLGLVMPATNVE
jgi:ribosome assembly protein YihI (activator of Der GTPase)